MKRMFLIASALIQCLGAFAPAQQQGVVWRSLNEPGCGGWVTSLAVSPYDSNRVLVGGDMLGIGLSEDRGESWQDTFGLKSWEIGGITWHPGDPKIVWAGTMSGPYVSLDCGRNWQERRQGFPKIGEYNYSAPVEVVLFDPSDARHLLAFGGSSRRWKSPGEPLWGVVWESRDSGASWIRLTTITADGASDDPKAKGRNIVSAAYAARSSKRLYAAADGAGLSVSEDGGKTWTLRNSGLPHAQIERVVAHPSDDKTLWISLGNHKPKDAKTCKPGGVFKSADAGATWTPACGGLSQKSHENENFTARYKGFAVSPAAPDVMAVCDSAWDNGVLYMTGDGGISWKSAATKKNIETAYFSGLAMTVMAFDPRDPNVLFGAGSEYIIRSLDGGKAWTDISASKVAGSNAWRGHGYSGLCSVNFRFDPRKKDRAVLIAMDAGKCWESRDGLKSWTFHGREPGPWGGGDDACFAGDTLYATFGQFGSFDGILRMEEGKAEKVLLGPEHGLPKHHDRAQPTGIYALPDNPKKVWAVIGGALFRSEDAGDHWRTVECGPKLGWIAGDPKNPKRFYVSGEKGVYRTEDGEKFTAIGGAKPMGRLAVDSLGRLYAVAYRASRPGLWRFADGKWVRLYDSYYLSNVAVDPGNPNRIAVSMNDDPFHDQCRATGVWISADAGKTWAQANEGLPCLRGWALAFNPFDGEQLVFGSQGQGYFIGRWPKAFAPQGQYSYASKAEDDKAAQAP